MLKIWGHCCGISSADKTLDSYCSFHDQSFMDALSGLSSHSSSKNLSIFLYRPCLTPKEQSQASSHLRRICGRISRCCGTSFSNHDMPAQNEESCLHEPLYVMLSFIEFHNVSLDVFERASINLGQHSRMHSSLPACPTQWGHGFLQQMA